MNIDVGRAGAWENRCSGTRRPEQVVLVEVIVTIDCFDNQYFSHGSFFTMQYVFISIFPGQCQYRNLFFLSCQNICMTDNCFFYILCNQIVFSSCSTCLVIVC